MCPISNLSSWPCRRVAARLGGPESLISQSSQSSQLSNSFPAGPDMQGQQLMQSTSFQRHTSLTAEVGRRVGPQGCQGCYTQFSRVLIVGVSSLVHMNHLSGQSTELSPQRLQSGEAQVGISTADWQQAGSYIQAFPWPRFQQ